MKVKQLRILLEKLPDDMDVILQKDSEGNGYSPLSDVDTNAVYIPVTTWYGDVYDCRWTADEACMENDEWEKIKKYDKCCILCPVN